MARKGGVTETLNKNCLIAPMGGQGYLQVKSERFNGTWAASGDTFESSEILKIPGMSGLSSIKVISSKAIAINIEYRTVGDGRGAPTSNWEVFYSTNATSNNHVIVPTISGMGARGRDLYYNSDMQNREFRVLPRTAGAGGDWAIVVIEFINI